MTRLSDHASMGPGLMLMEVLVVKHFCEVFERELPPPAVPEFDSDPLLPILPG